MNPLVEVTTDELLDELKRRSIGLLAICVRSEEQGKTKPKPNTYWVGSDTWRARFQGSPMMVLCMQDFINRVIREYLEEETKRRNIK